MSLRRGRQPQESGWGCRVEIVEAAARAAALRVWTTTDQPLSRLPLRSGLTTRMWEWA